MKAKEDLTGKVAPFLKKIKTMKKNAKIICCDNAGERKSLKENCANNSEEITFELPHQALHRKWSGRMGICYTLLLDACDNGT